MECLKRMVALAEGMVQAAAELLQTKFQLAPEAIATLKQQGRAALSKPAIRMLERRWDENDITAEAFQETRLGLEMQTQLRLLEKYRRRYELSEREWKTINASPMQDHEIAHIWGIPAGSLAARKVKYLHQYLQALHKMLERSTGQTAQGVAPLDLWKETLAVLGERPVERSVALYDGLERTEEALLEKLHSFAWGMLPEETEGKFWLSLVHGASTNAVHAEPTRSVFGLQRLLAVLSDIDTTPEAIQQELLLRTAPVPKEEVPSLEAPAEAGATGVNEMQQHILHSFLGEDHKFTR
jgi:hypothetical protein